MEADNHDVVFDTADDVWQYIMKKSMMSAHAIVMPRNDAGPGGLEWLQRFKFPSKSAPDGARSQTLHPDQAQGLFDSVYIEVTTALARARPESTSPAHDPPRVEANDQAPEFSYVTFKEGLATVTHAAGFIGGANTAAHRTNMMVNTDWVAGYRDFKKLRVGILEKMTPELRSFIANAPVDMSGMPVYVVHALEARFEVDFMDLKLLYLQAFIFWRKGGIKSTASILKSIKTGTDCLEGAKRAPERPAGH